MADFLVTTYLARTPQDFWAAIVSALSEWGTGETFVSWSIGLVEDDQGPGIEFAKETGPTPDTFRYRAVWDDATWHSPMPGRPWASTDGTSGELQQQYATQPRSDPSWEDIWDAMASAIQDWMFVGLELSSSSLIDSRVVTDIAGRLSLGCLVFLLDEESSTPTYIVWNWQVNAVTPSTFPTQQIAGYARFSPSISPITNAQMFGASIDRIAGALEDMVLQDVEVEINHGQAMYSVRGKVTTG